MARNDAEQSDHLESIKRLTIVALFSDDELVDRLVLKGGNALALGYGLKNRVSVDLDFSMADAFNPGELDDVRERIASRLNQTFRPAGWMPFDICFVAKPKHLSEDLAEFWGGLWIEFQDY